ncbi:hypothetical protein JZO70_12200 [Enterococcus sp. 669A]|uniref:Uncharacterized protein n=1 Tax=Candidatus Enterococcus moelleringii TaxID=2815325 RepID=A0ABS3LCW5_9ENTE|nr:hypothetical protein [Enterococcus sp. 669A]MBO1306930.1 hypothetical protein [Enterococcus sp. 669A]
MQKVTGIYFTHPLDLSNVQAFQVDVPHDTLYGKGQSVPECNQHVLKEIASKYQHSLEDLHTFFVIENLREA